MNAVPATPGALPLAARAHNIRRHALRMGQVQGQGYIGQALGAADLLAVAYFHALRMDPANPEWSTATASTCPSAITPLPCMRR